MKKFITVCSLFAIVLILSGIGWADSDIMINPDNSHFYQRIDKHMWWEDAKTYCQNLGGYLATLTSKEENQFVYNKLVASSSGSVCWLGGTDKNNEGQWQWITGEPWNYTNWSTGEPNSCGGDEDYLWMWKGDIWNDNANDASYCNGSPDYYTVCFICEHDNAIALDSGWSMISLPVVPESLVLSDVFPGAVVVYRYEHDVGYVSVQQHEELEVGKGYWILLNEAQTYTLIGEPIQEHTFAVADGWYMIGGCSSPAQKRVTNSNIDVIYDYTPGIGYGQLPESEPLEPGKGYWIKFSNTSEEAEFTASTSVLKPEPIVPSGLAPVTKTGQTMSYAAGDDGDLQKGVAWPVPRFTDHGDWTVTDNLTGLMWTKSANMYGQRNWTEALSDCASCPAGGHSDWRLPNVRELHSLIDFGEQDPALPAGHPFPDVQSSYYWSSTTVAGDDAIFAWFVNMGAGYVHSSVKYDVNYVWCVRGGQ